MIKKVSKKSKKTMKGSDLPRSEGEIALVLFNIRSAQNVGSIFRTADAVGVNKIYLVGYTPAPIDQFGRARGEISKTALGAESSIAWEKIATFSGLLKKISSHYIVAIEQSPRAVDYRKVKIDKMNDFAFVVGNEVDGLPELVLKKCSIIAEIPMKGEKESLNVAVATGVALFQILS
jgi:tRNA G18 (ribose-2'-O)-methylase SpoU